MIEEEIDLKLNLVKKAMLSSNNILLVSAIICDHYKSVGQKAISLHRDIIIIGRCVISVTSL